MIKRCAFTIVENQPIADELVKVHKLTQKPVAVRSTPEYWEVDLETCKAIREECHKQFGSPVDHIIMYHGVIGKGRGIDTLCEVVARMPKLGLLILGPEDSGYVNGLKKRVKELKVENRVLFHEAVPQPELWKYIGAADISMALIEPVSRSYELTLPNKVLESIQSLTPLILSALPGMTEINDEYGVGLTCNPKDLEDVCACISRMLNDPILYQRLKTNLIRAKNELCWEKEKERLIEAWKQYLG